MALSLTQIAAAGRRLEAFRALRHRNFRWFWLSTATRSAAQGMQFFVLGWLVLDLTDSASQLGLAIFLYGVPHLCLVMLGGVLADRLERLTLLLISQTLVAGIVLLLATLTATGLVALWHIYGCIFLLGTIQALNMPSRMAIVADLVDRDDMMNAVALNASVMNGGRILGPALAGALIELTGIGPALFLNGACYLSGTVCMLFIANVSRPGRSEKSTMSRDLAAGLRYFFGSPIALTVIGMGFAMGFFGMPYMYVLPAFAKDVLNVGAVETGFLLAAAGIGSLLGALALASLGNVRRKNWVLLGTAFIFGGSLLLFAWSPWYWVSWVIMLLVGLGGMSYVSMTTTVLQMSIPKEMQGRVLSIWSVAAALTYIGSLPMGVAADALGWQVTMAGGAVLCLLVFLALGVWRPTLRRLEI
ncbi:MAG: hypothetical protein BZY88_00025 [SAR202 cluster bacterium Io17-Chloro-G9]|nr:MAG: hypothetical protein BZY88_00025 [SAR202 cluster bacterium Io17-Chloro-G9]